VRCRKILPKSPAGLCSSFPATLPAPLHSALVSASFFICTVVTLVYLYGREPRASMLSIALPVSIIRRLGRRIARTELHLRVHTSILSLSLRNATWSVDYLQDGHTCPGPPSPSRLTCLSKGDFRRRSTLFS
jgi:hypothetical protein